MTPRERLLAGGILSLNLAIGLALARRADLGRLLIPDRDGSPEGALVLDTRAAEDPDGVAPTPSEPSEPIDEQVARPETVEPVQP